MNATLQRFNCNRAEAQPKSLLTATHLPLYYFQLLKPFCCSVVLSHVVPYRC
jgi:hypothetical protein